ncbi:MAG: hypothetical protein ACE5JZ_02905 [Kiloniellales bacterium]
MRRNLLAGALALTAALPAAAGGAEAGVGGVAVDTIGGFGNGAGGPRLGYVDVHYPGVFGYHTHHEYGHGWGLLGLFNFPSYFATPEDVRPWWSYYPPQPVWDGTRLMWLTPRFPKLPCSDYLPPYNPGACPP